MHKLFQSTDMAYKGYLIRLNTRLEPGKVLWSISKDGYHIGSSESPEAAKKSVDELVN